MIPCEDLTAIVPNTLAPEQTVMIATNASDGALVRFGYLNNGVINVASSLGTVSNGMVSVTMNPLPIGTIVNLAIQEPDGDLCDENIATAVLCTPCTQLVANLPTEVQPGETITFTTNAIDGSLVALTYLNGSTQTTASSTGTVNNGSASVTILQNVPDGQLQLTIREHLNCPFCTDVASTTVSSEVLCPDCNTYDVTVPPTASSNEVVTITSSNLPDGSLAAYYYVSIGSIVTASSTGTFVNGVATVTLSPNIPLGTTLRLTTRAGLGCPQCQDMGSTTVVEFEPCVPILQSISQPDNLTSECGYMNGEEVALMLSEPLADGGTIQMWVGDMLVSSQQLPAGQQGITVTVPRLNYAAPESHRRGPCDMSWIKIGCDWYHAVVKITYTSPDLRCSGLLTALPINPLSDRYKDVNRSYRRPFECPTKACC